MRKLFTRHFSPGKKDLDDISDVTEEMSEDEYRKAEYNVLVKSSGSPKQPFHSIIIQSHGTIR